MPDTHAQNGRSYDVMKDYYLFPIKPGIRNTLAGTMGELRRTHFHTGIDIRTAGVQGVPVHAAAAGYLSRIVVSPGGYGNTLYLTHPNGQVTVYGHLKSFSSPVKEYVRAAQYERQSFAISLFPSKGKFKYHKGDTIALSGNSGSSGGPHLHFEIRDQDQKALNPLSYGFEEIVDERSPEVRTIGFTTFGIESRVNDLFGTVEVNAIKNGNNYVVEDTIRVFGKIGLEVFAFDRQDWTRFRTGINEISVRLDGKEIFRQEISKLSFAKSRDFYNYVDYGKLYSQGRRIHKLYVDDGNGLDFYQVNVDNGFLYFEEDCLRTLEVFMYDSYRNESSIRINLRCETPKKILNSNRKLTEEYAKPYQINGSTLMLNGVHESIGADELAVFYSRGKPTEVTPAYTNGTSNIYLWDLSKSLPDSAVLCNMATYFRLDAMIPSNVSYQFFSDYLETKFSRNTLFDTAYLFVDYEQEISGEVFFLGPATYPVRKTMEIKLHPRRIYDQKDKTHVYAVDPGGNTSFLGGNWDDESISFDTRAFGKFTLQTDSTPPLFQAAHYKCR